ncbi:thioredoxin-like protein [Leucosporidium creatinivorum]|uniref:Thioredoxin-like protein n=1 Tax=Leucosporidium creatinivorum TaxID=106004 RepID=A0A1Y2DMM1_9BASI|nr:thioredoxin-like protein [Leucosporidium creatinivorum]
MPALDYNADTEFNDALRKHGIIPEKEPTSHSPSPVLPPASPTLSDLDLDDLDLNKDDALSREVLEKYREERMAKMKVQESNKKFGRVYPIGKVDYKREVTEASNEELEGEPEGYGTGVVCVLYKDHLPECKILMPLLNQLAQLYPSSKFVSIISDHCIENYPDKNCPTMIIYRKGQMMGQIVGMGSMGGEKAKLVDVERILFAFRGIDFHLKVGYGERSQYSSTSDAAVPLSKGSASTSASEERKEESDEDSEDDQTFVGGGRKTGIRQTRRQVDSDDDEFDL